MRLFSGICMLACAGLLASCCYVDVEVSQHVQAGQQYAQQGGPEGGRRIFPNPLPVTARVQEGSLSCWAACGEMVMEFLGGGRIRQCEQAIARLGNPLSNPNGGSATPSTGIPNNCCDSDGSLVRGGDCDHQWYPELQKWGFVSAFQSGDPLSWGALTAEINDGRPFIFSWAESASVNHMMVVVGYDEVDGDKTVLYIDPLYNPVTDSAMAPYEQYTGGCDECPIHEDDYFMIHRETIP